MVIRGSIGAAWRGTTVNHGVETDHSKCSSQGWASGSAQGKPLPWPFPLPSAPSNNVMPLVFGALCLVLRMILIPKPNCNTSPESPAPVLPAFHTLRQPMDQHLAGKGISLIGQRPPPKE